MKKSQSFDTDTLLSTKGQPVSDMREVYRAARAYVKHGLSLIPIRADATKMPAFELLPKVWDARHEKYRRPWSGYRERPPSRDELREWFRDSGDEYGMAILAGSISGGLEIIDLDNFDVVAPWCRFVDQFAPGLLNKLVLVRTPRPGLHAYYRCEEFGGNQKLARMPDPDNPKKPKTVIEVKAEGGYCLAPPSPAACHPSGRSYTIVSDRDLTEIPTISPKQRKILLGCARTLNSWQDPKPKPSRHKRRASGDRPGDYFNAHAEWADILVPHGWIRTGYGADGSEHWSRPDKGFGTSATTNFEGTDLLYVFSSNAPPFDEMTTYSKFQAYALLEYDGEYYAAARALKRQGYGNGNARSSISRAPFVRYSGYAPIERRRPR